MTAVIVHVFAILAVLLLLGAAIIAATFPIRRIRYCPSPWTSRLVYGFIILALIFLVLSIALSFFGPTTADRRQRDLRSRPQRRPDQLRRNTRNVHDVRAGRSPPVI